MEPPASPADRRPPGPSGATGCYVPRAKHDPSARGAADEGKTFDGKKVKPVLYVGTAVGHGRYIAVQDEGGKLIMGRDGKPIAFRDV
jgi:hypothetical protein